MCGLTNCIFIMAPTISTNVQAEVVKELGKGFLIQKYSHWRMVLGQNLLIMMRINRQFSLYKEEMVMLIVGMERQYIMI